MAVLFLFRLKDPPRDADEGNDDPVAPRVSPLAALSVLVRTPTAVLLTLAYTGMIFVYIGYMTWTTTFLYEKFDLSLPQAGFYSMFYFHLFALGGVLAGGWLSDRWARGRWPVARLAVQCAGLLFSAPFIYIMGMGSTQVVAYLGLAGYGLFRGVYDSNIYVSLYCVIERRYHASATGVMTMFGFMVGALSPTLLGLVKPTLGLSTAFAALSVVHVFSAAAIFLAMTVFFAKDRRDEGVEEGVS